MSKIAKNKKYVTLEGVRVSYRSKDDSIQITSTDDDLTGENFHLVLKKGTDSEKALRNILVDQGLIREDLREDASALLPKTAENPYLGGLSLPWNKIALGVKAQNETVIWDVTREPHSLIVGATGSGKSVLQRTIFHHCLTHGWDYYGIDLKRVELSPWKKYAETVKRIATTKEEGLSVLTEVVGIMEERYTIMEEMKVNNFFDLPEKQWKPIMLMIDEALMFLELSGSKTTEGKADDENSVMSYALLMKLVRLGRAAGIHVTIATQRPDATIIKGEMKANLDIRIAAGRMDATPSAMVLDSGEARNLPGGIKGRGMIRSENELSEFQAYYTNPEFSDQWVLSQRGKYEKERYAYLISQLGK